MSLPDGAVEFPFELPSNFASILGCPSSRQFIAFWWDGADDLCYHDGIKCGCGSMDNWEAIDFFETVSIESWFLDRDEINLGRQGPATHWFIVDTAANDAIIITKEDGERILQNQTLE